MFKKEIKFIYDFNVNEIKKLGNFVTYDQLLSANIHPAILQYISADIDYLIFEDRQKILSNSVFDYSGEKIRNHFSLIGEEIKRTKRFSHDYMSKLILHASSFTINFLVRPRWALTKFIFDDENHKNTAEIKQILNYLYYYGHLRRIITSYINRKKILSINEKEFSELLDKIDGLSLESNSRMVVHGALKSMADFFSIGDTSGRGLIPLKAVEYFIEEKELKLHLQKLRMTYGEEEKNLGLVEYLKLLDEVDFTKVEEYENNVEPTDLKDEIETEIPFESGVNDIHEEHKEAEEALDYLIAEQEEVSTANNHDDADFEEGFVILGNREAAETLNENEPVKVFGEDENNIIEDQYSEEALKTGDKEVEFMDKVDETELMDGDGKIVDQESLPDDLLSLFQEEVEEESEDDTLGLFDGIEEDAVEFIPDESENNLKRIIKIEEDKEIPEDVFREKNIEELREEKNDNLLKESPASIEVEKDIIGSHDISKLLEDKNLSNVIEVIFDYDIEDFEQTLEAACSAGSLSAALEILETTYKANQIDPYSKEADSLKSVVMEYYNKKR